MPRLSAVLLLPLLVLAGGCGGRSSEPSVIPKPHDSTTVRAVRTTVQHWLASLETRTKPGDNARACAYLTVAMQRSITQQLRMRGEHGDCKTYAAKWTGGSNPPGRDGAHVTGVTVAGKRATATLQAPPDRTSDVQLERVGNRWLIDNY